MIHPHLSYRVNNLSESATLLMTRKSRELRDSGIDVINLSIGEPDFNTPDSIKEAAIRAIHNNITHYPPVAGFHDLRKAVANKLKRDNGLEYKMDQIVISSGAKQAIANTLLCLVNPGDEVLIPSPYWVSYPEMVKLADGHSVFIPSTLEQDFKVTPEQVRRFLSPRSKVFIFSSPCNPSGTVYTKEELYALARVLAEKEDLYVISDEIYEEINFTGKHESIAQFDFIKERVVTINGVSKGFAMTGWRIGYSASNKAIAEACNTLQGQTTSGAATISQMAALEALEKKASDIPEVVAMKQQFLIRRDFLLQKLAEIPGLRFNIPSGAFYIFPEVSYYIGKSCGEFHIGNDTDLCLYLLEKAHVALVPGIAFGCENHIRISYACSLEELEKAMDRIKQALELLK